MGAYYGFTGIHKGYNPLLHDSLLLAYIKGLDDAEGFVTGAAEGIDTEICLQAYAFYPEAQHIIVVPDKWHNVALVEEMDGKPNVSIIRMDPGTDYRARNEMLVEHSDRVVAFPLRRLEIPGSGTWMTANIAKREGKLYDVVILP